MMKMKKFVKKLACSIIIVLITALLLPVITVLAIDNPDSAPAINAVYVYEDCYEDGDVGALIDIEIDYAVNPTETATQSYLVAFIDSDGTTILKTIAPYNFYNDGYGHNLVWIRFTPSEVTTYGISSADQLNYRVWILGNPTLTWPGDPPKTEAQIDYWMPSTASAELLLGIRVLYYADLLEQEWSTNMIEDTPVGNRLSTNGEAYFTNVIPYLRDIAPNIFESGEINPLYEDLDYSVLYGAVAASGTATVVGSPAGITEGGDTITVSTLGTITITLNRGVTGNITDDTGVVTGSPVTLVPGENTLTVTGAGDFTVTLETVTTGDSIWTKTIAGTVFDLSGAAAIFSMEVRLFTGFVWFGISVIICSGVARLNAQRARITGMQSGNSGSMIMIVFDICIIGGAVIGMLPMLPALMLFIGAVALTALIVFFKGASF